MLRSIRNGLQLVAILLAVWGVLLLGEWLGVAGVGMRARSQAGNVVENTAKDVPAEARATLGHTPRIPSSRGIVVGGNAMGAGRLAVFKREQSFPGLTIYPISGTAEVLLLSHAGAVVHRWEVDADRARLLPNGNLLVVHGSKWGLTQPKWRNLRTTIREYAWSGEVVWE